MPKVDYLAPHACALLHFDRTAEARAGARPLLETDYSGVPVSWFSPASTGS